MSQALLADTAKPPAGLAQLFPGWSEERLQADYWIARSPGAKELLLDPSAVSALAARALAEDPALVDLAKLPVRYPLERLRSQIEGLLPSPAVPRYHPGGRLVSGDDHARWRALTGVDTLAADLDGRLPLSWALVTQRTPMRAVPSLERMHSDPAQGDLDRLQETALFPGTAVAVLQRSTDGRWRFVQAEDYAGWIAEGALAHGDRVSVLDYRARSNRVIIAAQAQLAYTPEAPSLSSLVLDMGLSLPEWPDWPPLQAVNGQGAFGGQVLQLPTRGADGRLVLQAALLPRHQPSHAGPLPATRANVLRQAFRFLGERYGWGHDYDGRDCSGLVQEIYRSLGLPLPRNADDQAGSPVFPAQLLSASASRAQRLQALAALKPGDLIHLPGHVAIVIGHDTHGPWLIHDVHEGRVLDAEGAELRFAINGVAVTPLLPLRTSAGTDYLQAITALQPILPAGAAD